MLIVGLTGSIGMGKSTVAARFRALGIAVFDADAEVHKLYEGAAVPAIEAVFPGTTDAGKVDRQRLAQALLVNPGTVVSRRDLLAALPSGTAGSEHAVEMAVARLRAALGTRCIQTVVKRGYRLAVSS